MRKTSAEVDVDGALREVMRAEARRREIRILAVMEGLDIADEKVMANAWRQLEPDHDGAEWREGP